jgi:hypothetical protein
VCSGKWWVFSTAWATDPSDPDEHFGWEEYLALQPKRGFTLSGGFHRGLEPGAAHHRRAEHDKAAGPQSASYLGTKYQLKESYSADHHLRGWASFTGRSAGGKKPQNRDFASGKGILSLEQTANELTWSVGSKIDSDLVAKAFKLDAKKTCSSAAMRGRAARPRRGRAAPSSCSFCHLAVFLLLISRCSSCDPNVENCSPELRAVLAARMAVFPVVAGTNEV